MSAETIQQMADRVAALIEVRLGVRGNDLAAKLRNARGRIPAAVRAEAQLLETAAMQAQNPKLLFQIDEAGVIRAHDACIKFLNGVDRAARRRAVLMGMVSSIAFSLFAVGVIFLAVLYWRGFIG